MRYAQYQSKFNRNDGGVPRVHAVPAGGEQVTLCNIYFKDGGWKRVFDSVTCKKCLGVLLRRHALIVPC